MSGTFFKHLAAVAAVGVAALAASAGQTGSGENIQNGRQVAQLRPPYTFTMNSKQPATALFTLMVAPGYHIQSDHPKEDYLIPTTLDFEMPDDIEMVNIQWPAPVDRKFSYSPDPISVFEGANNVVRVTFSTDFRTVGKHQIPATFHYQACNDQACLAPVTQKFVFNMEVIKAP